MDMETSFDRSSPSLSRCVVSRSKAVSRDPLFSPALTNAHVERREQLGVLRQGTGQFLSPLDL